MTREEVLNTLNLHKTKKGHYPAHIVENVLVEIFKNYRPLRVCDKCSGDGYYYYHGAFGESERRDCDKCSGTGKIR